MSVTRLPKGASEWTGQTVGNQKNFGIKRVLKGLGPWKINEQEDENRNEWME